MATKNDPCIEKLDEFSDDVLRIDSDDDVLRIDPEEVPRIDSDKVYAIDSDDVLRIDPDDVLTINLENDTPESFAGSAQKEEFYSFLDNLPKQLRGKFDPTQVKEAFENPKSIRILMTGKSGSGKSTIVRDIFGVTIQRWIDSSNDITVYHIKKRNVDMAIWYTCSPGLQDGTDDEWYLKKMKKCQERDLTLYCIDVRHTRFISGNDNPDVVAMKKLTREFGPQFWSNTVIVLTFFNCIADDIHIEYLETEEEKTEAVEAKLQEWKDQIVHILTHVVKIDRQVAEKILIVPAGHYREPHLPNCKNWLSNLWFHCFTAVSTQEGQLALLKANLRKDTEVQPNSIKRSWKFRLYNWLKY